MTSDATARLFQRIEESQPDSRALLALWREIEDTAGIPPRERAAAFGRLQNFLNDNRRSQRAEAVVRDAALEHTGGTVHVPPDSTADDLDEAFWAEVDARYPALMAGPGLLRDAPNEPSAATQQITSADLGSEHHRAKGDHDCDPGATADDSELRGRITREVSMEWLKARKLHVPPDDTSGDDDMAYFDEIERRIKEASK